eukprot:Skav205912  [mRNA]  locus=scaffold123:550938:557506:+ [translate_table: standard]
MVNRCEEHYAVMVLHRVDIATRSGPRCTRQLRILFFKMSRETRHHTPVRLTGEFYQRGETSETSSGWTGSKLQKLETFMRSQYVANFMVVVVLIDTVCTCSAIDARAAGENPSDLILWISDICLCLYSLEAGLLLNLDR